MRKYTRKDLGDRTNSKTMKQHLLEMLVTFDKFCKENGLRYYLSGGTLLGAIRHQGFIPWDDDIDVNMPRPDCEKLMKLSGGRIGPYILNPPNSSKSYHAYHWKLYDESILVGKRHAYDIGNRVYPIFIDIFPIEGLPDTEKKNAAHYRRIFVWKKLFNCVGGKPFKNKSLIKKLVYGLAWPIAKLFGTERLFNKVIETAKTYPFDESDYIGVMMTNVHTTEERVVKEEYLPVVDVKFEGHTFPAPAGYDTYLRQLYGDYMQLPPEEKRVSHHKLVPYHAKLDIQDDRPRFESDGRPVVTIAICGLIKSENLGEMFIARSLEYLIQEEYAKRNKDFQLRFVEVDLLGREKKAAAKKVKTLTKVKVGRNQNLRLQMEKKISQYYEYSRKGLPTEAVYVALKKLARKAKTQKGKNTCYRLRHFIYEHGRNYRKRLYSYFDSKMSDADYIVVDGAGLLEYSYNEYQESLLLVSEYAKDHGLSVVYNAIGRAGEFNEEDFRSTILKDALQADVVKYVSARDSRETVQLCAGDKHEVKLLADAAFWMKEAYHPQENAERKKVGIGIIRGNSLTGYNVDFDAKDWVRLFTGIANELEARGYDYEFFTNGLPGDIKLGKMILMEKGLPDSYLVKRPKKDDELYETINGYQGLITCRMHSSIAAFTLQIPTIILSWNDKVVKLMKIIGYPKRAITLENFDPILIVDRFEAALKEGVADEKLAAMKAKALESVTDYIDDIVRETTQRKEKNDTEE